MSVPLRVMLVTNELHRGGAETQMFRLSLELRRRGVPVDVVSIVPPRAYAAELSRAGVAVHVLARSLDPTTVVRTAVPTFAQVLRRRRPDVLVGFLFHASNLVRVVGRAMGTPAVITSVRSDSFGSVRRDRIEQVFQRLRADDLVVTNSRLVRDRLVRDRIVQRARVTTIGNAINVDEYAGLSAAERLELRRSLGIEREPTFLWLAIARYNPVKDHPAMLRAFARARIRNPETRVALRVVGAGDPDEGWYRLRRDLGLEDAVEWAGTRRDIPRFLQAGDALVLSSRHEGLPNAIMEAFAAGLPVVSTDVGGVRELLRPGVSGTLVRAGDPQSLGNAMSDMMQMSPGMRSAWGEAGRAHIRANFGTSAVTDQWQAAFLEALFRGRQRVRARLTAVTRSRSLAWPHARDDLDA